MPISPPLSLYLSYLQVCMHSFLFSIFILSYPSLAFSPMYLYHIFSISLVIYSICVFYLFIYILSIYQLIHLYYSLSLSPSSYFPIYLPIIHYVSLSIFITYKSIYLSTPYFLYIIHLTHSPLTTSLSSYLLS